MTMWITDLVQDYLASLYRKSVALVGFLSRRMRAIALAWVGIILPLAALKLAVPVVPYVSPGDLALATFGFSLVILAPLAGYLVARGAFERAETRAQPRWRLAFPGRWTSLSPQTAQSSSAYGPAGFMASLLVGMMLNIVFRTGEFLLAVPVMGHAAPLWGQTMFWVMILDVTVTGFFYMVCFAMALRTVPLFPRMLLFAWVTDIAMQMTIAQQVGSLPELPVNVAQALANLLEGNVTKVLISATVWLPYLLLSERVNITYRHRSAAVAAR